MTKTKPFSISTFLLCTLTACTPQWQATHHYDSFTEATSCRVEKGTESEREFTRGFTGGLTGMYFKQNFFAENHDGEIRAGIRSEPPLPISGDVQIKIGSKLYTLTSEDVPLDVAPTLPKLHSNGSKEFTSSLQATSRAIMQMQSPYRAFMGEDAKELLRAISAYEGEIRFRTIGVNTATSTTGHFTVGPEFAQKLRECEINL